MRLVHRASLWAPVWLLPILLAAPAAYADNASAPTVRVIEVTGTGEVRVSPDVGYLGVGIETHARTATQASSDNAASAQKVLDALKQKLGAGGTVSTGGYSLEPEYRPTRLGETAMVTPEIIGYVARNSVTLETPDLHLLGGLIDAAVAAGANHIEFVRFGLRDDVKPRTEAITKASADAQAQAHALAASLGVKLKRVIKASPTMPQPIMPLRRSFARAAVMSEPTPIEPGQMTVSVTVSLTYEIE